ncbi:ORF6N domain-containing protein [Niabella hirudinis]|uniref:ORF6N domain-containing protein n=1 Tax=Niabella hirudinis TaxID=1285929 RepID=UPI003EB6E0C8
MVRGVRIMLDKDLAEMYGVETRRLNEQVKRNAERFPESFMFRLTNEEVNSMVSQNAMPSKQVLGGTLPSVFTEHVVLMLANVLKSSHAHPSVLKPKTPGNKFPYPLPAFEGR